MDLLEKGITDHYHLSVIFASLKDCKHTQSVLVISHSKCRNMSSLSFPLWFVYRHLSPARHGQTLPLLYLTKWKESVCHPTWAESWNPEFPFSPLSSHFCSICSEPSHICCEFSPTHLPELSRFFWNILLHSGLCFDHILLLLSSHREH